MPILSCKKSFFAELFSKRVGSAESVSTDRQTRSAVPTAKLGRSGIKIVTVYPDGVELIKVERSFLKNSPKTFCKKSFWRYLFSKR